MTSAPSKPNTLFVPAAHLMVARNALRRAGNRSLSSADAKLVDQVWIRRLADELDAHIARIDHVAGLDLDPQEGRPSS